MKRTLICEGRTDAAPPWILYGVAAIGLLFGSMMFIGSIPTLLGNRPGDLQGGLAGIAVGLILFVGGVFAVRGGRSRSTVFRVQFFEDGLALASRAESTFVGYRDLTKMAVVVRIPSAATQALAVTKSVVALVNLNGYRFGRAFSEVGESGAVFV